VKCCQVIIPLSMIWVSDVHEVLNLGKRMAAAVSSGSSIISPNLFWSPSSNACSSGKHNLLEASILLSFALSWNTVGSKHPMWVLLSDCRTVSVDVTGFITATYSERKAISAGFNLKDIFICKTSFSNILDL